MTAKYDRDKLTFQYPENWKLEEDPPSGIPRTISVTAPSGAFWSATVYEPDASVDDLIERYLDTLADEYEDLEQEPIAVELGPENTPGIELQFYCLDFLVRSRLFGVRVENHPILVTWQAEDREFDELEMVFRAITFTLVQEQPPD